MLETGWGTNSVGSQKQWQEFGSHFGDFHHRSHMISFKKITHAVGEVRAQGTEE